MIFTEYENHEMFRMMRPLIQLIQKEMERFFLSEEELFYCYTFILDAVKKGEPRKDFFLGKIDGLLYKACRELGRGRRNHEVVRQATDMIWMVMAVIGLPEHLLSVQTDMKPTHGQSLGIGIDPLGKLLVRFDREQKRWELKKISQDSEIWDKDYFPYIQSYMNSDEHLSEEIVNLISTGKMPPFLAKMIRTGSMEQNDGLKLNVDRKKAVKELSASEEKGNEEEADEEGQLTNRQLILLFTTLFDLSIDNKLNQNALAKFIGMVSGKSAQSLRQSIRNGIDFDNPKTKEDAKLLASLIRPFSDKIAHKLIESTKDD